MTKDDVICMASKAGLTIGTNMSGIALVGLPAEIGIAHITLDEMHHFADIVAKAEREECAQVCFELWNKWIHEKDTIRFPDAKDCAAAIRARGQE